MKLALRAAQAAGEFVVGLGLLCLLATLAVAAAAVIAIGFIGSTLLVEAGEMWGTLRDRIRTVR